MILVSKTMFWGSKNQMTAFIFSLYLTMLNLSSPKDMKNSSLSVLVFSHRP